MKLRVPPILLAFLLAVGAGCDSSGGDVRQLDPDVVALLSAETVVDEFGQADVKARIRNTGKEMLGSAFLKFRFFQDGDLVARTDFLGVSPLFPGDERTLSLDVRTPQGQLIKEASPAYSCYSYEVRVSYESSGRNSARREYAGTCE